MSKQVSGRIQESVDGLRNRDRANDKNRLRETRQKVGKEAESKRKAGKDRSKRGSGDR